MIGLGILRAPGTIAEQLPHPALIIGIWVVGAIFAWLGSTSVAEVAAAVPRSGGFYPYAERAFGPFVGFVAGYSDFLSSAGVVASGSYVFGEYLGRLIPSLASLPATIGGGLITALFLIQLRGVKESATAQQVTSLAKALLFVGLIVACLASGSLTRLVEPAPSLPHGLALGAAVVIALQGVIYAYDGWFYPIYFGEEMKDPGRSIPRAIMHGLLAVAVLYVLINVAMLAVLSPSEMKGQALVAATAAGKVFGQAGGSVIALVATIGLVSGVNASLLATSRTMFAVARGGLIGGPFTRVNAGGTPWPALIAGAGTSLALLATGSFGRVLAITSFYMAANYVIILAAVFMLRWREPDLPRPYRARGYPWTTGLGLVGFLAFLAAAVASDRTNSLIALAGFVVTIPAFYVLRRRPEKVG